LNSKTGENGGGKRSDLLTVKEKGKISSTEMGNVEEEKGNVLQKLNGLQETNGPTTLGERTRREGTNEVKEEKGKGWGGWEVPDEGKCVGGGNYYPKTVKIKKLCAHPETGCRRKRNPLEKKH